MRSLRQQLFVIGAILAGAAAFSQDARTNAPNRIFRDRVQPHWFADVTGETNEFWYRVTEPQNRREFILVNAATGWREPAFDHERVAKALSALLKHSVEAEHLPVEDIEFSKDGKSVALSALDASWKLDLQTYSVTAETGANFEGDRLRSTRFPLPSRTTGAETEIRFANRLNEDADIFWVDPDGKHVPYGTVRAGESRELHTYAGHVWLVTSHDGNILDVFEAEETAGLAVIERQGSSGPRQRGGAQRPARTGVESPDGKWEAVVRGDNLFLHNLKGGEDVQLTYDGNPNSTYARDEEFARNVNMDFDAHDPEAPTPNVYWSPDSKHLVAMRLRPGTERRVYEVESSPENQLQPELQSYPYLKAGDQVPVSKPQLFDVETKKKISVSDALFTNPWTIEDVGWDPDSSRFAFVYNQRGHQVLRGISVDARTGEVKPIIDEKSKTFIDYSGKYYCHYVDDSGEIIWMSERDGWNHLYLYDGKTEEVKNQITKGQWVVRSVDFVDEKKRQIWFQAGGIVPGQDPYYVQHCRVNFDGSGLVILTEGDGTHTVQYSPGRRFLIDTWSRVDSPPVNELRDGDTGKLICELEKTDASELDASGWKRPQPFSAKGRDGVTDIYGVVWLPKDYDSAKKYPVIEDIYAGPQDSFAPKAFSTRYPQQELADCGFIVVQSDGMGTANRSKKFHDVCWKNLKDGGFPDRVLWIKAAAQKYSGMDLTRVGIYGTSAGGQDALRGILDYGDFYKACVADSGCYDNRMDKIWWNEQWMGWPVDESYVRSSCVPDAHKLKGKLLLMVGELDKNVDPASTFQVVNALIKADKNFDLLDMPGAGHGVARTPYGKRRLEEFFVKTLLAADGADLDSYNASSQESGVQ
ncbi:MAG TPA: DPP IV N-terminal domain-containing protein [Verrucomicrobiae bacterium]